MALLNLILALPLMHFISTNYKTFHIVAMELLYFTLLETEFLVMQRLSSNMIIESVKLHNN